MNVSHNADVPDEAVSKMIDAYDFPNVRALYQRRHGPKEGMDAAKEQLAELEAALAAQQAEAERLAGELAAKEAEAAEQAQAHDEERASRDVVVAEKAEENAKLADDLAKERSELAKLEAALAEQEAEAERLAEALAAKEAENDALAAEVGAFREKRNAALQAREADGELPVESASVPAGEAASRAVAPDAVASAPLYCATLDELQAARDNGGSSSCVRTPRRGCGLGGEGSQRVVTRHFAYFDGNGWGKLLSRRPQALLQAFRVDASGACDVLTSDVTHVCFDLDGESSIQASTLVTPARSTRPAFDTSAPVSPVPPSAVIMDRCDDVVSVPGSALSTVHCPTCHALKAELEKCRKAYHECRGKFEATRDRCAQLKEQLSRLQEDSD